MDRREAKRQLLAAAAAAAGQQGSSGDNGGGGPQCTLRVKLPDGSTAQSTFQASQPVSALFDFVDSLEALSCWEYNLVSACARARVCVCVWGGGAPTAAYGWTQLVTSPSCCAASLLVRLFPMCVKSARIVQNPSMVHAQGHSTAAPACFVCHR